MAHQTAGHQELTDTVAETAIRPPIWAEGRQRPKFDPVAWAVVATTMAQIGLVPAIDEAVALLDVLGNRVRAGELRVTGQWAKRVLPSHESVGHTILALGRSLAAAKPLLKPPAHLDQPLDYANLTRSLPAKPAPAAVPKLIKLEPTLHAIRSAIASPAHDFTQERPQPRPAREVPDTPRPSWLQPIVTRALLAILMLFAWPGGAARALHYHLDGGDLRDWS